MMRKVERSCCHHGGEAAEFAPLVEDLVRRYTGVGLLNDEVFAKARVSTLRRQGRSRRAIEARLQGKGLPRGEIEAAMAGEEEGAEFDAALHLARKKKLGPFRVKEADPKKEMAAMARAGFSFEVAKRVLDYKGEGEE